MRFPRATRPRVPDGGAPRIRHQRGAPCRRPALRRALDLRVLLFHEGGARARRRTGRMPSPANFGSRGLPVPPPRPALRGFHASAVGSGVPAGLGAASAPLAARCGSERRASRDPLPRFAGLWVGPLTAGGAFPAFMRTRYSGSAVWTTGGRTTGRALACRRRRAGRSRCGPADPLCRGRATGRSVSASRRYLWRCQHPAFEASLAANLD